MLGYLGMNLNVLLFCSLQFELQQNIYLKLEHGIIASL